MKTYSNGFLRTAVYVLFISILMAMNCSTFAQ